MYACTDLEPCAGNARVVHAVERVSQVLRHDDRAVNSQPQVDQCRPHHDQHLLHPVDLLAQEDVQRLRRSDLLQTVLHLPPHTVNTSAYLYRATHNATAYRAM